MLDFMAGLTDRLAKIAGDIAHPSLMDLIPLEAVEDKRTLCLKDGTLASMIDFGTQSSTPGDLSHSEILSQLRYFFIPFLKHGLHSFEITFIRSQEDLRSDLVTLKKIRNQMCLRMGLNLEELLENQFQLHGNDFTRETTLLTLYTWSPLIKRKNEANKNSSSKLESTPQKYDSYENHLSMVDCLARDLSSKGYAMKLLDINKYLHHVGNGLYPQRVVSPGHEKDHLKRHTVNRSGHQNSIDWELSREDVYILEQNLVALGGTVFGGFDIALLPEFISPFNDLVQAIADTHPEIPFRCSFKFDGLKPKVLKVKEQYVKFFGFTNPMKHRNIRRAFEHLSEDEPNPDDLIRLRIGFTSWVANRDIDLLRKNLAFLKSLVEQWGNMSTDIITGDPVATILGTVPGFGPVSTAPEVLAPIGDALILFPLARQTSPWSMGEIMFQKPDGVAWPYKRGSTLQSSWIEILIGSSGMGKSVALNALNLGSILDGSSIDSIQVGLPKMVIVDVGNSSLGLIRILQEALPEGRKNEAIHLVFKLLAEQAINPFDTPLGFRQPLSNHRNFLINFLTILVKDSAYSSTIDLEGFLGLIIEKAYEHYSDWGSPKRYYLGEVVTIDNLLEKNGFEGSDHTSWWEVTDWLFSQGYHNEANLAQTRAVPILPDLIQIIHSPSINNLNTQEEYQNEKAMSSLISHLQIRFSEAVRDFPIFTNTTKFDLGAARVVAIDLAEVLGPNLELDSQRRSSLMFMLARHVAIREWGIDDDEILAMLKSEFVPECYADYHLTKARSDKGQPKILCIDEYHRASGVREINTQLIRDAREGRKRNFRITLASQFVNDFDPEILGLASTVLIFGNQLPNEVQALGEWFPLSEEIRNILARDLTGPTSDGAPLVGIFRTTGGTISQKLYLKLCSDELWEFSTTPEDVSLRDYAYKTFGVTDGRKKLCWRFPRGTAKTKIVNMKHSLGLMGPQRLEENVNVSVLDKIIKELYAQSDKMANL